MTTTKLGTVTILRGIPGSGKSTYQTEYCPKATVFSADHFFIEEDGHYNFDPTKLPDAHAQCLRRFAAQVALVPELLLSMAADGKLEEEVDDYARNLHFIVDNTNISVAEIAPYYQFAEAHGLYAKILTILPNWQVAAQRNIHDVPSTKIWQMHLRLERETLNFPPWWRHSIYTPNNPATAI